MPTKASQIEALKREKVELEEKYKSLAEIIEHLSKKAGEKAEESIDIEPKLAELNEKIEAQISALKEEIASLKSRIGKPVRIRKEIESFLEELREKSEPRLASLEEQIKTLQEKLENLTLPGAQQQVPTSITLDIEKFSRELNEVKDVVTLLKKSIQEFKQLEEPRIVGLEERVRLIEERVSDLVSTFSEDNIRRLKEIISTTSEIYDNFIPKVVQRETEKRLETVFKDINVIRDTLRKVDERTMKLNETINHVEKRLIELDKVKNEINFLYKENDSIRQNMKEEKEKLWEDVNKIVSSLEKKMESLSKRFEKIEEIPRTYEKIIEEGVLKKFNEVANVKFSEFNELLNSTLESVRSELEVVKSTHSDIRVAIDELTLKLNALEELQENNITRDDLKDVERKIEDLNEEVSELSEWKKEVNKSVVEMKNKVDEAVLNIEEVMKVQKQMDGLLKTQHEIGQNLLEFGKKCKEIDKNVKKLEKSMIEQEKLKGELKDLKKILTSLVNWKEKTEKRIKASLVSEGEVDKLTTKLENKLKEFEKKMSVFEKNLQKLEKTVVDERNEIKERLNKLILELRSL
jgi:chromosome segregation ATPase